MQPEPIACRRCSFPRTLRMGDRRVCFQCRYSWQARRARPASGEAVLVPVAGPVGDYAFTLEELRRLAVYRAAVRAGFFTDAIVPRERG